LVLGLAKFSVRRFIVKYTIIMPSVLPALSGCGRSPGERALSGAIGGAVGAGIGALTSPRQIELNRQ
jgi:hypothetical protein